MDLPSKEAIAEYWSRWPADLPRGGPRPGTPDFFLWMRDYRYGRNEPFLRGIVDFPRWSGKRVLEIGCGLGTDAASFAEAGADYTGIDLGELNVQTTTQALAWVGRPGRALRMDAERMDFPDGSFDLVYSHGVIHHSPDTQRIVDEAWRVLRPGGRALLMVYHRDSFRYYVEIMTLRRAGILLLQAPGGPALVRALTGTDQEAVEQYRDLLRREGWGLLRAERFLTANTDLAGNPLSRCFGRAEFRRMLARFEDVRLETAFMDWGRLPGLRGLRRADAWLGRWVGWFLFAHATKPGG